MGRMGWGRGRSLKRWGEEEEEEGEILGWRGWGWEREFEEMGGRRRRKDLEKEEGAGEEMEREK